MVSISSHNTSLFFFALSKIVASSANEMASRAAGYLLHFGTSPTHPFNTQCATHCITFTHTHFPYIQQGSILLSAISPSVSLTIIVVFSIFTINPSPSDALLHRWKSPLNRPNFCSSALAHQRTKFHSIILLLHLPLQNQPQ